MKTNTSQSEDSAEEKNPEEPTPILFYIMLGFIVISLAVFLVLSPIHHGSTGAEAATPAAQH